jgi:predicted phosphohydrolase
MIKQITTLKSVLGFRIFSSIAIQYPLNHQEVKRIKKYLHENVSSLDLLLHQQEKHLESFQYCSDLHVDTHKKMLNIKPIHPTLLIAGDLGSPLHPHFESFLSLVSKRFNKVYFIAGNHEYESCSLFNEKKFGKLNQIVAQICDIFSNVYFLDNNTVIHNDKIVIAGTTLWSMPILKFEPRRDYADHVFKHKQAVKFIEDTRKKYAHKKIVLVSHYLPSLSLIEEKYKARGALAISWFGTNLDYLINDPIVACVGGHSHSVLNIKVNGVPCMINAHGYPRDNSSNLILPKEFTVRY